MVMITDYCDRIGLCDMAKTEIFNTFDNILSNKELFYRLMDVSGALLNGENVKEHVEALAPECGVHPYTLFEVVLIYSLPALEHTHKVLKLDAALFEGVLEDIKAKTIECYDVYGIVGNICYDWYIGFYNCKRACLGRLQFEHHKFRYDYRYFKEGDRAINCHIPSTGSLKYDDVMASFKWAYEYFADARQDGILPIVCSSWLLHKPTSKCFKPGGGLELFYNLFDIIYSVDKEKNPNFWRVFGCEYKDFDKAPADTSLRRAILDMIKSGQNMGDGYGVILFDGEKIVNK